MKCVKFLVASLFNMTKAELQTFLAPKRDVNQICLCNKMLNQIYLYNKMINQIYLHKKKHSFSYFLKKFWSSASVISNKDATRNLTHFTSGFLLILCVGNTYQPYKSVFNIHRRPGQPQRLFRIWFQNFSTINIPDSR